MFCEMRRDSKPRCQTRWAHFHTQLIFIQIMGEKPPLAFSPWQPALPISGLTTDCLPELSQESRPANNATSLLKRYLFHSRGVYAPLAFSGYRPGKLLNVLWCIGQIPMTRNYLDPNINSVQVEKSWINRGRNEGPESSDSHIKWAAEIGWQPGPLTPIWGLVNPYLHPFFSLMQG